MRTIFGTFLAASLLSTCGGMDLESARVSSSAGDLLAVARLGARAEAEDKGDRASIVGSWETTVTATGGGTHLELSAFSPGGILMTTSAAGRRSSNPSAPPPIAVDDPDVGYGVWTQEDGRIALSFKRWLFAGPNTPAAIYGPSFVGQKVGFLAVQGVAQLSDEGDMVDGRFTVQFKKRDGSVVFAGSGTWSAKRMQLEPPAE